MPTGEPSSGEEPPGGLLPNSIQSAPGGMLLAGSGYAHRARGASVIELRRRSGGPASLQVCKLPVPRLGS